MIKIEKQGRISVYSINKNYEEWTILKFGKDGAVLRNENSKNHLTVLRNENSDVLRNENSESANLSKKPIPMYSEMRTTKDINKNKSERQGTRALWIKIFPDKKAGSVEKLFIKDLLQKFGKEKTRNILITFREKGFNKIETMKSALDKNGNIIPKKKITSRKKTETFHRIPDLSPEEKKKWEGFFNKVMEG